MKTSSLRSLIVGVLVVGASACGSGAPFQSGKEAAAHGVYDSSQAAEGQPGGNYAQGAIGLPLDFSMKCAKAGNATLKQMRVSVEMQENVTMEVAFDLALGGCSHDGETFRDGTLAVTKQVLADENGLRVRLTLKGRVNYSGDVGDFIDVDVTQEMNATLLSATSGSVLVTLDGSVENSTGTYVFDHEQMEITAGFLPILEIVEG